MTDNTTTIRSLLKRAENYGDTSIQVYKLRLIDKSADIASTLISRLTVL